MIRFLFPLVVFLVIGAALFAGLRRDPRELPSALIGKPAPAFELPVLEADGRKVRAADMRGKVWVLNVWASWCGPCELEHPLLVDFAARTKVPVVGLNYKDKPEAARAWLRRLGNPYTATLVDPEGKAGIDFGVYGVPETFVIDRQGIVRHRQAGPLTQEVLDARVGPLIRRLEKGDVDG